MKVVIQRVKEASVTVENKLISSIDKGFLLLVGIKQGDDEKTLEKVADKVANLRIFTDENDKMNLSLKDVQGEVLSISQFTLYADCKKGRRPSFAIAEKPELANALYEKFNELLRAHDLTVKPGIFGADMKVSLLNDGPVTIILDSEEL